MKSGIIQIVRCDNYDSLEIPQLHIFMKIHFTILKIILIIKMNPRVN